MQNYITSFSASKSSQFVNDQLSWDEGSPHRHDCHDPPHGARVGFLDDRPPPRRLAAVARSDPWKVTRAQAGFPGDATRRRRLLWVASDCWNTGRGEDYPLRDQPCEDDLLPPFIIARTCSPARFTAPRTNCGSGPHVLLHPPSV